MGRWMVVRVRALWHIVFQAFSLALWDMRTADVMLSAVGWDFTGFLCSFTMPVTEGLKNAFGSRRCTSYPEKQRTRACVKIYRLPCKSLWNIVYGGAVNFHSGNRIVLWAHLFMGVFN